MSEAADDSASPEDTVGKPERDERRQTEPAGGGRSGRGHPPSRARVRLLVSVIVVMAVAGSIATAFMGPLATRHPLLFIMLEARNRNLILARHVDLVPFIVVGTVRRVLTDPLYWLLGWWYGDRSIRWLEHKAGGGMLVQGMEKLFARAAYPMVFLFPGAVVCALAGATGMPFLAFLAVNLAGTIAAVVALRLSGDLLSTPVEAILGFFNRHLVATTVVTVSLVVLSVISGRLQGKSELPSVDELEGGPAPGGGDEQ